MGCTLATTFYNATRLRLSDDCQCFSFFLTIELVFGIGFVWIYCNATVCSISNAKDIGLRSICLATRFLFVIFNRSMCITISSCCIEYKIIISTATFRSFSFGFVSKSRPVGKISELIIWSILDNTKGNIVYKCYLIKRHYGPFWWRGGALFFRGSRLSFCFLLHWSV